MAEQLSYVVIGNGIAGVTAAETLRAEDAAADITVIADDPFPVYYRPALKDYLAGRVREDKLWARSTSFYQDSRIRFLSDRVIGIQAGQHTVQLASGRTVGYSRLLLANGARASRLTCPGTDLMGVTTLRTVADYQAVVSRLSTARRIVVSGSGTLALETLETLRHRGYQVIHLLRRRTLWSEVLDATASDLVLQQERRDGVDVRIEEEIAEINGKNGQVIGVVTTGGSHIPCDMVLIAIGVEPILDFIKSSGIPCGRGVKVDSSMRTSAPDIYAAGDVLETSDPMTGRTRVIGQWYPAIQQGRAAAYSMLDLLDSGRPFRSSTFYNATFLYGLDFASVGLTQMPKDGKDYQEIVADPQPRTYRKVLLKGGIAVGMLALGDRKGMLVFKRAIDSGVNLTPVASTLFAENFKLHDWLDRQGVPAPTMGVSREGAAAVRQVAYAAETMLAVSMVQPQSVTEAFLVPGVPTREAQPAARPAGATLLSSTKVITIGRQPGSSLLIDHGSVSRRHAEISYVNGQYALRDVGSSNGTVVNDTRLVPGSVHILKHNEWIRFGDKIFTFLARGSQGPGGATSAPRPEKMTGFYDPSSAGARPIEPLPPLGQPVLNADGSLLLPGAASAIPASVVTTFKESPALIVAGSDTPNVLLLKQGKRIKLGRDKGNDIVLAEVTASRKHAEVFPGPDGFYMRDLGSSNGVIVNHTRIDNPYRLAHGDCVTIGSISIYFIDARAQALAPARPAPAESPQPVGAPSRLEAHIQCRNCGTSNVRLARFCANCGAPVEQNVPVEA